MADRYYTNPAEELPPHYVPGTELHGPSGLIKTFSFEQKYLAWKVADWLNDAYDAGRCDGFEAAHTGEVDCGTHE